jgi:hypothetical protein
MCFFSSQICTLDDEFPLITTPSSPTLKKIVGKGFGDGFYMLVGGLHLTFPLSMHPSTYMLQCDREAAMAGGIRAGRTSSQLCTFI